MFRLNAIGVAVDDLSIKSVKDEDGELLLLFNADMGVYDNFIRRLLIDDVSSVVRTVL